jgi:hypothetical protein
MVSFDPLHIDRLTKQIEGLSRQIHAFSDEVQKHIDELHAELQQRVAALPAGALSDDTVQKINELHDLFKRLKP